MRVWLELRPALDGYGGIPQEVRLLFDGLLESGCHVEGLIQSAGRVLPRAGGRHGSRLDDIDRQSRTVIALAAVAPRAPGWMGVAQRLSRWRDWLGVVCTGLSGRPQGSLPLSGESHQDFIWRHLFARTLRPSSRSRVCAAPFWTLRWPWAMAHALSVLAHRSGLPCALSLHTAGVDVLIAETPFPMTVSRGTRLVIRFHDAVPVLLPHTVVNPVVHQASHWSALVRNVRRGAWLACVSAAVAADVERMFPEARDRIRVIPNFLPDACFGPPPPLDAACVLARHRPERRLCGGPLLLVVGTLEPRKNHALVWQAWERLRSTSSDIELMVVGGAGWASDPIVGALKNLEDEGRCHWLQGLPAEELRALYHEAAIVVCPSVHEGFDFPGVEAMAAGTHVIASDIPVHREVFADGCEYVDPYDASALADAVLDALSPVAESRRQALRLRAAQICERYRARTVLPAWRELLEECASACEPAEAASR